MSDAFSVLHATTLGRRYVLGATLTSSAGTFTHEAYDLVTGRTVSVQVLPTGDSGAAALLPAEALALAAIEHPAVVRVHEVREDAKAPFVVRALSRGTTLSDRLLRARLPAAQALSILRQVAAGLDALHAAGIVHGDVQPSNILMDRDDVARLTGVGVAAFTERVHPEGDAGMAAYRAPERRPESPDGASPSPASDIYSFGVTSFEVLMGRLPFARGSCDPLPDAVDRPLAQALARSPGDRPSSCTEIVDALDHVMSTGRETGAIRVRVVIADDDRDQRELLASILGTCLPDANLVLCAGGQCALDAVSAEPTTVALLDLVMPAPSGTDLVRLLRAVSPKTAVVIVTGRGSGEERAATRALGVRRFLVKPFEVDDLVRAVREAVHGEPHKLAG